tara:strand:- start:1566 stop:1841 length:276 start_codon:yes stop_codon:yes gene_type:complete
MAMWNDRFSIDFDGPEDTEGHLTLSLLGELSDAYIGVIYHPNGPPISCYSHPVAAAILSHSWNISKEAASNLIDYLAKNAKGKSAPAFLKT